MKRLKDRFEFYRNSNPDSGDPIIMCMAVRGQGYTRRYIRTWYLKLVNKDEYDKEDLNELLDYLEIQTAKIGDYK